MSLTETLSKVALIDELAKPTEIKTPSVSAPEPVNLNPGDFSGVPEPTPEPPTESPSNPEPTPEPEEPYDAETEAKKLVSLCNAGNTLICSPLAVWKLKKKRGGAKEIEKMKTAWHKRGAGMELTDREKTLALTYETYLADTKQLSGDILFTKHEIEAMEALALPYCEKSRIKINDGAAFWTTYAGFQVSKILKILTA